MNQKKKGKTRVKLSAQGKSQLVTEEAALAWLSSLAPQMTLPQSEQVSDENPKAAKIRAFYFQLLYDADLIDTLEEKLEVILDKRPRDHLALFWKAQVCIKHANELEAISLLKQLLKQQPTNTQSLNLLACLYKDLGDFDEAEAIFKKITLIDSGYAKAYWNRSDITSDKIQELSQLEDAINHNRVDKAERFYLHFSAYRLYENTGDYEKAFLNLEKANQYKRSQLNYDLEQELALNRRIEAFFNEDYLQSTDHAKNVYSPIFIVGFPRSGTSLIEQILASHSQVRGGGELPSLIEATSLIQQRGRFSGNYPDWLSKLSSADLDSLAQTYWSKTANTRDGRSIHTDKNLLNYKAIGLIAKAFPNAKVIALQRSALDTCFGCYRQLFSKQSMPFCYDFEELANCYSSYLHMIAHWQKLLPNFVHTINYEDFVAESGSQTDALLKFCGLKTEKTCYEFYKTDRVVKTLSSTQVRQPIFQAGIDRWKPYEKHLGPLIDALKSASIDI